MTRRSFAATGVAGIAGLVAGAPAVHARRVDFDVVVRNGLLFDGSGAPGARRDLAVRGDRIASIAERISERGTVEIDAREHCVSPGFIDIHSHGDGSLTQDPRAESVVRQGITTIIAGQDGSSRGDDPGDIAAHLSRLEGLRPGVNVASMVGLGSVRGAVVGEQDRPASAEELRRMVAMVERALGDGACGASSGLEYTPGAFASRDELIALCRPLAALGLPYATHMRNEDDRLLDSIDESIAVARGARCPLQISHLKTQGPRNWDKLDTVFARIDQAHRAGLDVAFDRYPYIAYQTGLTNLFPVWSRDGGTAAFLARLGDNTTAPRIRRETLAKVDLIGGWNNVLIAGVRAPEDRAAEGKRLGTYAQALGKDPYDESVAMLRRNNGSIGMVGFAMSEENLDRILAHPLGMVCSDGSGFAVEGPTRRGNPHPRGIGSFPRVLARYVRERKALTLPQAIHKMSAFPASRVKLAGRGLLAPGAFADVVVFDASRITDRATFEEPFQYPEGISAVIVNGVPAILHGERQRETAGRIIRPSTHAGR
jgi:N-acyl-D-amino-acid deacylase